MTSPAIIHLPYVIPPKASRFHFYENYWKKVALNLLSKHLANLENYTLLDYGCGRGETMAYAHQMGMKVKGLDLDPECVQLASEFGPTELLDLQNLELQVPEIRSM